MGHQVITLQLQPTLLNFSQSYKLHTHTHMPQNRQEYLWGLKDNKKSSWGFIFFLPHEPNKTIQLYYYILYLIIQR